MLEAEAIIADDLRAAMRNALERLDPAGGEIATLTYWSDFREPDGRPVEGFVPGYLIDSLPGPPRADWIRLRVPGIGVVSFWPRFGEHEARRLVVTFASASHGTFALTKAD